MLSIRPYQHLREDSPLFATPLRMCLNSIEPREPWRDHPYLSGAHGTESLQGTPHKQSYKQFNSSSNNSNNQKTHVAVTETAIARSYERLHPKSFVHRRPQRISSESQQDGVRKHICCLGAVCSKIAQCRWMSIVPQRSEKQIE